MIGGLDGTVAALALIGGYLSGSIPFGLVFGRLFGLGDIRKIGSGNIGATNALRTGNKPMAALTLLGDVLKGTIPVLVAWQWGPLAACIAGLGAFLGHVFPVWLGFRGGKGVATYLGILFGLGAWGGLVFAALWLAVAFLFRFSSLAALVATVGVPVFYAVYGFPQAAVLTALLSVLVWWKHAANIRRLIAGTEGRIGAKG